MRVNVNGFRSIYATTLNNADTIAHGVSKNWAVNYSSKPVRLTS
ncbi:MAG: hypothetical protein VB140_09740 [Burkholderia sp.]